MNNLKTYRTREGLSQAELGAKTGFDQSMIARVEAGGKDFKGQQWKIVAKALNCTIDELLAVKEGT